MSSKRISLKRSMINFIIILLIFANLGLGLPSYFLARGELEDKGEVILSNAVHMAIEKIKTMDMNVKAGTISLEDAQESIKTSLIGPMNPDGTRSLNTPIDLGENGYFIAYTKDGFEAMHPNIEGQYVYNAVTPDDEKLFVVQEQLRIGQTGGFFEYNWYYPDQTRIGRKLSYSMYEPNWEWTIVATAYAADFNDSATRIAILTLITFLLTVLLAFSFTSRYIDHLLKPFYAVVNSMKKIDHDNIHHVKEPDQNNELLDLVEGYNLMQSTLKSYIDSLKERETQLKKIAFVDELSTLPNIYAMSKFTNHQIEKDYSKSFFLLLDIKNLKVINSMYGLSFGNDIIKSIADRLKKFNRIPGMLITRITGNEFGIWIPNGDEQVLLDWITTTRTFWSQEFYAKRFETNVEFTISYTEFEESDKSFEVILQRTNVAMQYAKANNLDLVKFSQKIYANFQRESILKIHAEQGLLSNEFYPVYQEKVNPKSGEVKGVEALARWESKELGFIGPGEFIPIFNRTKLILDLTEKMIDYVFADYKKLVQNYSKPITVSVNISPLFFMNANFVTYILEKASEHQVPTNHIILEITEDVFIDSLKHVNKKIEVLRQAGFKIALDDFGTGYSSLSYLQNISLDEVKIDKSLVDNIESDLNAKRLLHSIIEVINNWGYEITAEGVETAEQVKIVQEAGCNLIQGYYYSKPEKLT